MYARMLSLKCPLFGGSTVCTFVWLSPKCPLFGGSTVCTGNGFSMILHSVEQK